MWKWFSFGRIDRLDTPVDECRQLQIRHDELVYDARSATRAKFTHINGESDGFRHLELGVRRISEFLRVISADSVQLSELQNIGSFEARTSTSIIATHNKGQTWTNCNEYSVVHTFESQINASALESQDILLQFIRRCHDSLLSSRQGRNRYSSLNLLPAIGRILHF